MNHILNCFLKKVNAKLIYEQILILRICRHKGLVNLTLVSKSKSMKTTHRMLGFKEQKLEFSKPEFFSVLRDRDVARNISENSASVFDDGRGFVPEQVHQEGQGTVHATDVSLERQDG